MSFVANGSGFGLHTYLPVFSASGVIVLKNGNFALLGIEYPASRIFLSASLMQIRMMTTDDIAGGVRLNTIAGWNQTEADWRRFVAGSPQGCFVTEDRDKVVGTAATFVYENRFAWISMVLVDPEYRNRGIGTELLRRCIEHLDGVGIPTLKLDATPMGKPIYEKLGFVSEYEIERWHLQRAENVEGIRGGARISAKRLLGILKEDREVFGGDRSALLRSLDEEAPDLTLAIDDGSQLQGYAFGRRGRFADHLGPWMARDRDTARLLLAEFLQRSERSTLIVDALESSALAGELLRYHGFSVARPLTRMYRGPNRFPGRPDLLCGIVGPEFG